MNHARLPTISSNVLWISVWVLFTFLLFVFIFFNKKEKSQIQPQPQSVTETQPKTLKIPPSSYEIGDSIYFGDLIVDSINYEKFSWNFGDNTSDSLTLKPFHVYNEKGVYKTILTCTVKGVKYLIERDIYISCIKGNGIGFSLNYGDVELGNSGWVFPQVVPTGLKQIEWDIEDSPKIVERNDTLFLTYDAPGSHFVKAVVKSVNCETGNTVIGEAAATVIIFDSLKISDLKINVGESQLIHSEDFESVVGKEWSHNNTDSIENNTFLGQFGNGSVNFIVNDLAKYKKITFCFDLYILGSWDGENMTVGPDFFSLKTSNNDTLVHATFDNFNSKKLWDSDRPLQIKKIDFIKKPSAINSLNVKYKLCETFYNNEENVNLIFSGYGLQNILDESWGIDNIKVYADSLSYKPTMAEVKKLLPHYFNTKKTLAYYIIPLIIFFALLPFLIRLFNRLQKPKTPPPDIHKNTQPPYKIPFPEQAVIPATPQVYQLAKMLRQRQAGWRYRMDILATVRATIAKGGFPVIRQRGNTRAPEYLFLIDLETPDAQQVSWLEYVLQLLRREEVLMAWYYFKQDPSWCWNREQPDGLDIDELYQRFPDHRLVIYGDGDYWLDSFEARTDERVLRDFPLWSQRALLTTVPPENWSYRERLLQQYFNLIPGDMKEPLVLASALMTQAEAFEQIRQDRSRSTEQFIEFNSLDDIRDFLQDPRLVDWLAATTVYPEPQWEITLAIGKALEQIKGYESILTLPNLRRLTQIKWMNRDAFPENLRQDLLAHLHTRPHVEAHAREQVISLLQEAKSGLAPNSYAYTDAHIKLIQQQRKVTPVAPEIEDEAIRLADEGLINPDASLSKIRQGRKFATIAGAALTAALLTLILCSATLQTFPQIKEKWGLVETVSFDLPIRIDDPRFTDTEDSLGVKIVSENFQRAFNVMANEDYLVRGIPIKYLDEKGGMEIVFEGRTIQVDSFVLSPTPMQQVKIKRQSSPRPNVYISDVVVSDNTVNPGQSIIINARQYISPYNIKPVTSKLEYAWNTDTTWLGAKILDADYSRIGGGYSFKQEKEGITIPEDVSGIIYILLRADATDAIPNESNNADNYKHVPLIVTGSEGKPNIFLSDVTISDNTVNSGQTVTVNSRQHISSYVGTSIRSQLEYAWNTDTTWSGATILGTDYSSFKSGDRYDNESFSFTVPDDVSGTIYLLLNADAINNVIESDETDNREYIPLIIEGSNNDQ